MAERDSLENGSGGNPETVIEMALTEPGENQESDLENEGNQLARALNEIGKMECFALSILVVSLILLVYVILLIILFFTGVIDVC